MRICIIEKAEKCRCRGFKLSEEREIGSAEVYSVALSEAVSAKKISRLIRALRRLGITLCAVYEGFRFEREFAKGGFSVVCGRDLLKSKIPEMVRQVAEERGIPLSAVIHGGSFYESAEVAIDLLFFTKNVYVDSPEYEAIAEVVLKHTGAVVRDKFPQDALHIYLDGRENFLRYNDEVLSFSDFDIVFLNDLLSGRKLAHSAAVAQVLVICGILRENDIKTVLSQKENT